MIGFDGCCCDPCVLWKYDFSAKEDGPFNPWWLFAVKDGWSIVDGCLETSTEDAEVYFYHRKGVATSQACILDIQELADGAQLHFSMTTFYLVLTGGAPGTIGRLGDVQLPANLTPPFKLLFAQGKWDDCPSGDAPGYVAIQRPGDPEDYWYVLTALWFSELTGQPWTIKAKSLNGSKIRVKSAKFIKSSCADAVTGKYAAGCGGKVGSDSGYYLTVAGFANYLSGLNGNYYIPADSVRQLSLNSGFWCWTPLELETPVCTIHAIGLGPPANGMMLGFLAESTVLIAQWAEGVLPDMRCRAFDNYLLTTAARSYQGSQRDWSYWYADHYYSLSGGLWQAEQDWLNVTVNVTSDPIWP